MRLTPEEKLKKAKIALYKRSPFFSYILLHMNMIEDTEGKYFPPENRTMAVDNKMNLYWTPEFVEKINEEETQAVLCHETLHTALTHPQRGFGKNRQVANIAMDMIVNDILVTEGFSLPKGGIIPKAHEFTLKIQSGDITIQNINQKCFEEIYDEIMEKLQKEKEGSGKGESGGTATDKELEGVGKTDHHIFGELTQEERTAVERKLKQLVSEAATIAKQQGKLPAGLERLIDNILDGKVDWRTKLYHLIVSNIISDYSWALPSKRTAALGIYLPRPTKEEVSVVFHIDTSGSMGEAELGEALGELLSIMKSFASVKIDVLIGDAEMQNTFTLTSDNKEDVLEIAKGMKGGGGTSHEYLEPFIMENLPDTKLLIAYTDGATDFGSEPEGYKVLWLITKDGVDEEKVPYGEVIKL